MLSEDQMRDYQIGLRIVEIRVAIAESKGTPVRV
jgi:hypothetical protein